MPKVSNVFRPYDWQVSAWHDKSPTMLLTGAAGGGKSRIAGEKIHALMLKYAGATGIVGRKDRTSANRSVVPFLLHTVIGDTDWGVYKKSDALFEYANGSQLWVIGLRDELQREALRSIGKEGAVDFAWLEEANKLTASDDNEIAARMRGKSAGWRQIIYTTNPDYPNHWIKKQLIDGGKASVYYSRPEDNPANPADYIARLKNLTGVSYKRLWLGRWVQAEGAIYDEYDVAIHLIDDFTPPEDGRYFVSIDFGFTNPFTASLWYVDGEGVAYLYKQIYMTKRLVETHAKDIKRMVGNLRIEKWITDHDAEGRATLEKHLGISTTAAHKTVITGIEAAKKRLAENRVYFMRGALVELDLALEEEKKPTWLIDEIDGYRWSSKKQDTPVKENDHACDDFRYFIADMDGLGDKKTTGGAKPINKNYIRGNQNGR